MFSYGDNNIINLDENNITQLIAKNGYGKSNLSLIIQELLYNKNIKGLKKAEILNRHGSSKVWQGSIEFIVNGKNYKVVSKRTGATSNIELYEDGKNISDHKVLDTYKKIQEIIGCDFTVFSQLTYQSSTDSLEFLKATDTNRKKFLINLFGLEKYLEMGDALKAVMPKLESELTKKQGELKTVEDVLTNTTIPSKYSTKDIPVIDKSLLERIDKLKIEILNHKTQCDSIDKNNLLIEDRNAIVFDLALVEPEPLDSNVEITIQELQKEIATLTAEIKSIDTQLKNLNTADICYACKQHIDNSIAKKLATDLEIGKKEKTLLKNTKTNDLIVLQEQIDNYNKLVKKYKNNKLMIEKFEHLSQLINKNLPTKYTDFDNLKVELNKLTMELRDQESEVKKTIEYNDSVKVRNAKIDMLQEQKIDFTARQQLLNYDILNIQDKLVSYQMLKKTFSTNGIVAFKLENVTKQLESSINNYLSILSDGQFQIIFRLDNDKLNIIIINNGNEVSIESLSGGEFSRVQTSVLLAVRKTLSQLGNNHINLLFLDEITGVLDESGKEKLFELLQEEKDLNVFIISHEYSHPLIPKLEIVKENNISYIGS